MGETPDSDPYVPKERLEEELKTGPGSVRERDVQELSDRQEELRDRLKRLKRPALKKAVRQIKLLASLVKDYATGRYRKVPWRVVTVAAFALLYFLNPFDLVPDYIPGVGFIDDAALVGMAFEAIRKELDEYERDRSV